MGMKQVEQVGVLISKRSKGHVMRVNGRGNWPGAHAEKGAKGACFMQKETEGLLSLGHMEEAECQHMACCAEKKGRKLADCWACGATYVRERQSH